MRFQNDDVVRTNVTATFDRLDEPFEIATGIRVPPGDYHFTDKCAEAETSGKRPLVGTLRGGGGDFYGGSRHYVQVRALVAAIARCCHSRPRTSCNDVDLPQGAFTTHVVNARMNVNLSNRWLTTTVAQYDSASKRDVLFVRLNYIYRPGDDLFVVYNRSDIRGTGLRDQPDHSLMVKLTYSVDF